MGQGRLFCGRRRWSRTKHLREGTRTGRKSMEWGRQASILPVLKLSSCLCTQKDCVPHSSSPTFCSSLLNVEWRKEAGSSEGKGGGRGMPINACSSVLCVWWWCVCDVCITRRACQASTVSASTYLYYSLLNVSFSSMCVSIACLLLYILYEKMEGMHAMAINGRLVTWATGGQEHGMHDMAGKNLKWDDMGIRLHALSCISGMEWRQARRNRRNLLLILTTAQHPLSVSMLLCSVSREEVSVSKRHLDWTWAGAGCFHGRWQKASSHVCLW